jgi:hypothetical protein
MAALSPRRPSAARKLMTARKRLSLRELTSEKPIREVQD